MVNVTFQHNRNIFKKNKFQKWIYKLFPSAKFDGTMWGEWYPTIKIPFPEFRANYKNMPSHIQNKIAGINTPTIKGQKGFLVCLVHDVRPINKITNLHPDFKKYTGRETYGNKVEEVIEIQI